MTANPPRVQSQKPLAIQGVSIDDNALISVDQFFSDNARKQVGLNVWRLRKDKDWSQEELAHETGLHRTYISGIERGVRNPTVIIIARVAKQLGVAASSLLED